MLPLKPFIKGKFEQIRGRKKTQDGLVVSKLFSSQLMQRVCVRNVCVEISQMRIIHSGFVDH